MQWNTRECGWKHFEAETGTGVLGYGDTLAGALEQLALGVVAAAVDPADVLPWDTVPIHCEGEPGPELVEAWLNAVLREMRSRGMLFSRFDVRVDGKRLSAKATGEALDLSRHRLAQDPQCLAAHAPPDPGTLALARHGEGGLAQALLRYTPGV
jgi:SHS2 domain-containing protein